MKSQIFEFDFDEMTDKVRYEIRKFQNFNFVIVPDETNKDGTMAFFKKNSNKFPLVTKMAKRILCIVATSVSSECLLNQVGPIH
jgi:hypothetical protein